MSLFYTMRRVDRAWQIKIAIRKYTRPGAASCFSVLHRALLLAHLQIDEGLNAFMKMHEKK